MKLYFRLFKMKQKSKRRKSVKVVNENDVTDGVTDGVTDSVTDSVTDGVTKGLKIQISAAEKKLADLVLKVSSKAIAVWRHKYLIQNKTGFRPVSRQQQDRLRNKLFSHLSCHNFLP